MARPEKAGARSAKGDGDHEVFQRASTDPWKAHDRLLQDVVRRNHVKQIKFAGAPNFRHFNFMLIDKLLAYITEMDVMSLEPEGAPIRRWLSLIHI